MVAQRCLMEASGILKKEAVINSHWFLDTDHCSRGISEVLRLILILLYIALINVNIQRRPSREFNI